MKYYLQKFHGNCLWIVFIEMEYSRAVGFGHNSLVSLRSLIYKVIFAHLSLLHYFKDTYVTPCIYLVPSMPKDKI